MIDDKTLILYFYRDGLDPEQLREIEHALAEDEVLAARYEQLRQDFSLLGDPEADSAPSHLTHQWHDLIAREAQLERQKTTARPRRWIWFGMGTALAAVLTLGIAIGLVMKEPNSGVNQGIGPALVTVPIGSSADETGSPPSDAFQRGLQQYLTQRQDQLAGMDASSSEERSMLLLQIVAQNRLFERAAEQQDAPEVARLMRAFEPILLRLAAEDTSPEDAEVLRDQLAFELKAVLTKMQKPSSKEAPTI